MATVSSIRKSLACLLFLLAVDCVQTPTASSQTIGWMEEYALSVDRQAKLAELIPGSDDFFFYHCLYYQTSGQLERAEAVLRDWLAEHKGRETAAITAMIDRQRLLTYQTTPQRTIDHFVRRLGIKLDHAPPAAKNERRFPSSLDAAAIDIDALVKDALKRNDQLKPLGMRFLAEQFLRGNTAGYSISLREFLNRVHGAYIDDLDKLVAKDLASRRPNEKRFGDLAAHAVLTLDELRSVAAEVPEVADDNKLVAAVLKRLRPGADSDPSQQPQVRIDYLTRVEAYLRTLPASYNSMKAAATYRLLEANLTRGVFDRKLFERYLRLPRVSPIVHPDWARGVAVRANPRENFMQVALLPPIGDETALVRAHLEHFLRDAESPDEFSQYLQPAFLRRVFAETKLLYGVGDEQQWYRMLSASQRQSIRDAVELRLSADNPKQFSADEPTRLNVDVKNVQELVLRIYEINGPSYYRTHDKPIDTDIDLDGLVATHERKLAYNQPAVERHREQLELTELSGRGVWIVDLVGKGLRARALIRRGAIDHISTTSADGMVFTIIDQQREPIPTATMWVGSRQFVADAEGRIVIPPVIEAVARRAIISDGIIARQIKFPHLRERYRLTAGMQVDRTQLQSGGQAELLIRPRLMMGNQMIDPKTLKQVSVRIEAKDLDGVPTAHVLEDQQLDQGGELVVPIRVPARLAKLTVTLSGKIDRIADGTLQTLQSSRSWDIAGVRRTPFTHDSFLTRDGDNYVIEVRGRNGEPIANATLVVGLTTKIHAAAVERTLQTDAAGRVVLGRLESVAQVRYQLASGPQHQRDLELDQVRWANEIHTTTDRPIRLPLADPDIDVGQRYRLLETRDGSYFADRSDRLSAAEGLLVIAALPAGDYQLLDQFSDAKVIVAVVDGPAIGSVATGKTRHRSMSPARPLGIASIGRDKQGLQIQLSGNTDLARVHLVASRYFDRSAPIDQLYQRPPSLEGRRVTLPTSGFVSDLRLGDEYQYVLRRRYAEKYAGVMLPQPGVILNPWETEETTNQSQTAQAGDAPPPSAAAAPEARADFSQVGSAIAGSSVDSDYDFLADPGVVVANLRPDENGVVAIDAELIEGLPIVQIVVCDPITLLQRTVTASLAPAETVDLRLAKSLDAPTPYSFERGVSIAAPGRPLDLQSFGSAQIQVYPSVAALLKLYKTLVDDPRLAEFDPLATWHTLDHEAKLDRYTRLASHELHLFLWFHDRSFFDEVVGPYLLNKKEKQFIDHWLLGQDLTGYTKLWRYNQLNAAERALLAMRLPEARAMVRRELREIVDNQETNFAQLRKGIESALKSRDLDFEQQPALGAVMLHDAEMELSREALVEELRKVQRPQRAKQKVRALERTRRRSESDDAAWMVGGRSFGRLGGGAFFRNLDSTKQWAESQWDRVRTVGGPEPGSLIAVDPFWAQLASAESDSIEVSTHLLRPIGNRHSALLALAMCGLPLSAGEVALPTDGETEYRPAHAVAVVTKQLKKLETSDDASSILVGQRFQSLDQAQRKRSRSDTNKEPTEFLTGVAYRGQIVISNPNSEQQIIDLFWQLPAGSLPLASNRTTDSRTLTLEPFAVQAIEYDFYFPAAGEFSHYPATVSAEGDLIARGSEKEFTVVTQPTEQDDVTWESIARAGTADQIDEFLSEQNLRDIDWMLIAHRMQDRQVYQVIINVLLDANLPIKELWAYGFAHRDEEAMQSYLELRDDLTQRVGPVLDSPLLRVDPVERRKHELLEYAPLVRARIHRLGEENQILNPTFRSQYESFVKTLGYSSEFTADQQLVLAYYLLIQNRISASIETFGKIDRGAITAKLQYDYADAYLAMHREQYDRAEQVARRHADHPIPRWHGRFQTLLSQLGQRRDLNQTEKLVSVGDTSGDEPIAEGSGDLSVMDRELRQASASQQQPEVIVRVEGNSLRIDHRRAKEVTLKFYGVDLELLFSKAPFVREDLQRMAMVRPMRREPIEFDSATGVGRYELDENLRRQTLLVEVSAGAARSTALFYGGDITTYVSESFGQLQTTDAQTHRPISTAYVKVYARYPDGKVRFYKDGYTDSRGRFDYASISAADAQGASRFAILVISEEKGATLHDVAAPNQ